MQAFRTAGQVSRKYSRGPKSVILDTIYHDQEKLVLVSVYFFAFGPSVRWWRRAVVGACSDGAAAAAGKQAAFVDTNGGAQLHATTA